MVCGSAATAGGRPDLWPRPGLAAKYPGDAGIEQDPAVIMAEGFEQEGWNRGRNRFSEVGRFIREKRKFREKDPRHVIEGEFSLATLYPPGERSPGWMHYRWKPGNRTVYFRYYVKFSKGFVFGSHDTKLHSLHAHPPGGGGSTGGMRLMCAGSLFSRQLCWYSSFAETGAKEGYRWPIKGGLQSRDEPPTAGVIEPGRWHCIEMMRRENDPGKANGEAKMWLDGRLCGHVWNCRARADGGLVNHIFFSWWLNEATAKKDQYRWEDAYVVATKYIGPMAGVERLAGEPHPDGIRLTWREPPEGTIPGYAGLVIRYRTDNYPEGPSDGDLLVRLPKGKTGYFHAGTTPGTTYYYAAYCLGADDKPFRWSVRYARVKSHNIAPAAKVTGPSGWGWSGHVSRVADGHIWSEWPAPGSVTLSWEKPQTVSSVRLYNRLTAPNLEHFPHAAQEKQLLAGFLEFSDGAKVKVGPVPVREFDPAKPDDPFRESVFGEYKFPPRTITWVRLTVTEAKDSGLAEFEVYLHPRKATRSAPKAKADP